MLNSRISNAKKRKLKYDTKINNCKCINNSLKKEDVYPFMFKWEKSMYDEGKLNAEGNQYIWL